MKRPQKIASEFQDSGGLAILFTLIVVVGSFWSPKLIVPALLSVCVGFFLGAAVVGAVRAHKYPAALFLMRAKLWLVVAIGVFLYLTDQPNTILGAWAFGVYAGFWISLFAFRRALHEQLTFMVIGADLEDPKVREVLK